MKAVLLLWYKRYLTHPEAGQLVIFIVAALVLITYLKTILLPIFIAVIFAYLLDYCVKGLMKLNLSYRLAAGIIFSIFLLIFILLFSIVVPILIRQLSSLAAELPQHMAKLRAVFENFLQQIDFISDAQVYSLIDSFKTQFYQGTQMILHGLISGLPNLFSWIIYFVMVPLLIYFFLIDKAWVLTTVKQSFPEQRNILNKLGDEVLKQIGNYVKGKVIEMLIMMALTYIAFLAFGLHYALLLAVGVGLAILIPYIGAIVATIPVLFIGLWQFGLESKFIYLILVYGALMTFNGTVLVAFLFSEAVSMHPLIILLAVLVFGKIGGFIGVFLAIPLACLCRALIQHWPKTAT